MPSLIRLLIVLGIIGAIGYGAIFALATFVNPKPREITRDDPAGPLLQAAVRSAAMPPRAKQSARAVELFLDMLAAERGAGKNTLDAYARDLADLSRILSATGATSRPPRRRICAPFSAS